MTVAERVRWSDASAARRPQRPHRHPRFRILDDADQEDDESLQRAAHAEDVLQRHFERTNGQRSRYPRDP